MKLLFDQNISHRAVKALQDVFDCAQVRSLGLENKTDIQIWDFAKANGYSIVSFDADFYDLATFKGHPPKVIWLRSGNTRTEHLIELLEKHADLIRTFLSAPEYSEHACLELR